MNLLEILNDETKSAQISANIDEKFSSKKFWENDEKNYKAVVKKIEEDHSSIKMSREKYNSVFFMPLV